MKKLLATLMSAAMLLSFAACQPASTDGSSSDTPSEPTYYGPIDISALDTSKVQITNVPEDLFPEATTFDVAFVEPFAPSESQVKDLDNDGVIRVACMGDSITEGGADSNWPLFLQEYLNYLGSIDGKTYEVKNFGKAGSAVKHVLENTDGNQDGTINESGEYFLYDDPRYVESLTYKADLVIVQHGANDGLGGTVGNIASEGSNAGTLEDYFISDYTEYLIKPYVTNGAKVVISTPTYCSNGYVDSYVNGWISESVRQMAKAYGLQCVDLNKITQPRRESLPDGIHGNTSGYKLMAQAYANQIFGMELTTVKIKTEKNAAVEIGAHMTTAHSDGIAAIHLVKGLEDNKEFDIKIACDNFKPFEGKVTVTKSETFDYPLTPGAYNVALNCPATASSESTNDGGNVASRGVDGDQHTRWETVYGENGWFIVDLTEVKKINGVKIYWEGAYASHYTLSVSTDGENYTQIADVRITKEGLEATSFDEIEARYVKMTCLQRGSFFGTSFYEMQVLSDYAD